MTMSCNSLKPVKTGRYRYTKWRWRIMVGAFDTVGSVLARGWRLVRPTPIHGHPKRILILQLDHMGDAILTSPLISRLREAYPHAEIDVLASPSNREIFEANPDVNLVRLASRNWFERKPGRWALGSAVIGLGRSLRGLGYDLGIDVRGDILSVLVLTIAGIPRRLGWTMGGGGFLLTDVAEWVPGRHEVNSRLALLEQLGIDISGPTRVIVHASDDDRLTISQRLDDSFNRSFLRTPHSHLRKRSLKRSMIGASRVVVNPRTSNSQIFASDWDGSAKPRNVEAPLLAVHLGAGTAAKRWPTSHWRDLVTRFLVEGWRVVLVGGPDDVAIGSAIPAHPRLRDWTGKLKVTETSALLEIADFFIGSDSGPAHIAASARVPALILFSGTNKPRQWRPWSRRTLILRQRVACRPCHQKICPLADHPCMTGMKPERVHRAAKRWWARLARKDLLNAPL
jgi:heptosyltransferase-2